MSAPSASASSRAASGIEAHSVALALRCDPAQRIGLIDARQFHDAAPVAQRFADALVAVLVLHVHATRIGGDADVVGDEQDEALRIGRAEVFFDRGELVLLRAARVERLQSTHKEDLERRHQRRRARAVQHFEDVRLREVEVREAEVPAGPPEPACRSPHGGSARRERSRRRAARSLRADCFSWISATKRSVAANPAPT